MYWVWLGWLMLDGLITGNKTPSELADMAVGVLRKKPTRRGTKRKSEQPSPAHARQLLRALKTRETEIAEDEKDIRSRIEPFRQAVSAWMQVPGIDEITAWALVAEMGPDMARFATAEEAASWSCVCPGNHESAGKQRDGRTRKGNPWLRSAICEAAWGASRTKKSPTSMRNTPGFVLVEDPNGR